MIAAGLLAGLLDEYRGVFQRLIRHPSVFEHEHAVVDEVEAHLQRIGYAPVSVPFDPELLRRLPDHQGPVSKVGGRRNLVVRVPGAGGAPSLALNCHLDVVPVDDETTWRHPPFSGVIDAGTNIIYGRGAMDDRAGVVICLALLDLLRRQGTRLRGDLVVQFVLEDEITGNGTLLCLHAGHGADAAVILDGTRAEKGINQHAGNMQFGLRVRGRPASVSVSHMGANAAELLAALVLHLRQAVFARNTHEVPPWTRFPSPNQFVTQCLWSEGQPLTVPTLAEARCYVTFTPPLDVAAMRDWLTEEAHSFAQAQGFPNMPEFDWQGFAAEPVGAPATALQAALDAAAESVGYAAIDFGPSTGTSDLRHFLARGIPCVLYGPGRGFNPHRADEHYYLDDLGRMIPLFWELTTRWCGEA